MLSKEATFSTEKKKENEYLMMQIKNRNIKLITILVC